MVNKNKKEAIKMLDEFRKSLEVEPSSITTEEISGAPKKYAPRIFSCFKNNVWRKENEKRIFLG